MSIGILIAFSITKKAWQRFQLNPMLTSLVLSNNEMQMYPTITVCPENSENHNKIAKMIEKLAVNDNETKEAEELLKAIPNFSYGVEGLRSLVLSDRAHKILNRLEVYSVRALAFKLAKSCDEIFNQDCIFKRETFSCCDAFRPVYGEHGICYALNAKNYGENE